MSEQESKFPKTTGYIYSRCAGRLKNRKLELVLTDDEIAGDYDRKVVNRILNNTRTRNNPYLIPPAYAPLLVHKLKLKDECELFWGGEDDKDFIEPLFCNLLTDILDQSPWSESNNTIDDIIVKVLLDDVRYACIYPTVSASFEAVGPEGDYVSISPYADVNKEKQITYAQREQIRHNAILRLFKNTRPIEMFREFFREVNDLGENRGFSRLDKRLDGFVEKSLLPFLKDNLPDEKSLGMRVYSIVASDLTNYVESELVNLQRESHGFERFSSPERDEILGLLMSAGKDYIGKIEKLQGKLDALLRKEKFGR